MPRLIELILRLTIASISSPCSLNCDDFARLAQREREVCDLGQALVAQFCQRLARQEQDPCFGEFHENLLFQPHAGENCVAAPRRAGYMD